MDEAKPKLLVQKSLVAMAKNAVGSHQFRNLYIQYSDGREVDAIRNGELGCALFVTGTLAGFGLINRGRATVASAVKALEKASWKKLEATESPEPGDVLVWEQVDSGEAGVHGHIGFYVGDGKAVSNNDSLGEPAEHDWQFDGRRAVVEIWRYDFVNWSDES
jgi:hypothetical protein